MNCIKDLLTGKHHGVKMSMEQTLDGKTAFNFHFKPVYTTRMLDVHDVATMLQISRVCSIGLSEKRNSRAIKWDT